MRTWFLIALLSFVTLSGCLATDAPNDGAGTDDPINNDANLPTGETPVEVNTTLALLPVAVFEESVVDAAVSFTNDLYEPTMDVSDNGVIYITGHTILVDTTGAPVFKSADDGASWEQLPFLSTLTMPEPLPGGTPPPSDEIFLVAGDDGYLYGVDITLATFPVNMWANDGGELIYHNPNAYDEAQNVLQVGQCDTLGVVPIAAPAKDRPWAAYANGTLFMLSNPAGGAAQIGVMDVPPALPLSVGAVPEGIEWNMCAGPGGSIPGVPDIREDGLFAVPQLNGGALTITLGNAEDVMDVKTVRVFNNTNGGQITSHYGHAIFDGFGTLFVGIGNNTAADDDGNRLGQFQIASSFDGGESFITRTFRVADSAITTFYMDGNTFGPGSLVTWAVRDGDRHDYYTAQVFATANGPVLRNILLAIDNGPAPSAHVTGAAVGPDGRSYLATYENGGTGSTPISVWIQKEGPVFPTPLFQS